MKILLVGNYARSGQHSMQRFATLLQEMLVGAGHEVRLIRPPAVFGNLASKDAGLGKWLGYADRFLVFRRALRRAATWADVVHICDQANAVYVHRLDRMPNVVTCHDVLAIRSALGEVPEHATRWSGRVYQHWILSGLRAAGHIVCVSTQSQAELLRVAAIPADRTSVASNALNRPFRRMAAAEAGACLRGRGFSGANPFLLHVGSNEWYKNRPGAVRIFRRLAALPGFEHHHLVMVGKPWNPELRRCVAETELAPRIHETTDASDEDLCALYSTADALLFPSLAEGFGWPIVEAQACGCPVVTSNRAPMSDVAGAGAILIDPADEVGAPQLIADGLARRRDLVDLGNSNARRFTREGMLRGYLRAYERAMTQSDRSGTARLER